jgi:hypothetical protein
MNKKILLSTFIIGLLAFFGVVNATVYPFTATSTTYAYYKPGGNDVEITVEFLPSESKVRWTFDFPMDDDAGNGKMGYALVISFDKVNPKYQIHNNDGTCSAFDWGTHLYSPWDPSMGGFNGWWTWLEAWNTEVTDLDWISCTGEIYKDDNPTGIFTVTISCTEHPDTIYWAAHFGAGGFWDYGGLSKYPEEWDPWSGDASDFETADGLCPIYEIDIKPGSDPNSINLKSKGVVPVAVLTDDDLDASTINPETVLFAGAEPVRWSLKDVDDDGDIDMIFHFKTQDLDLDGGSTDATLTGETLDGTPITGTDTVNIVPK